MKREDPKDQLKRLFARFTDYLAQSERERAYFELSVSAVKLAAFLVLVRLFIALVWLVDSWLPGPKYADDFVSRSAVFTLNVISWVGTVWFFFVDALRLFVVRRRRRKRKQ